MLLKTKEIALMARRISLAKKKRRRILRRTQRPSVDAAGRALAEVVSLLPVAMMMNLDVIDTDLGAVVSIRTASFTSMWTIGIQLRLPMQS